MTKQILIPLDGSELSDEILGPIRRMLRPEDESLVLLSVLAPSERRPSGAPTFGELRDHLEGWSARLEADGLEVDYRIREGDPATEILALAGEIDPWLVGMTTHGRTGLARLVRGSVAERVLRTSELPLLLLNPTAVDQPVEEYRPGRILVPLDGSERAGRILPLAMEVARRADARVILFHAVTEALSPSPAGTAAAADRTSELLDSARREVHEAGLEVEVRAGVGPAADVILEAVDSERADLVAMSTHGRTGLTRWAFGSVAETVLRHVRRPLLVRRTVETTLRDPGAER